MRKNWYLILIGFATLALGIIAVITAWRLYRLRQEAVTPPAPAIEVITPTPMCKLLWWYDNEHLYCQQKSFCGMYMYLGLRTFDTKEECEASLAGEAPCTLDFCIPTPTATPTPSPTPTPTGTPTPTPTGTLTPTPTPTETGTPTPTPTGTVTPTPSPTATPTPTGTPSPTATPTYIAEAPTPEAELPEVGFAFPTIGVALGGILLIIASLFLVL